MKKIVGSTTVLFLLLLSGLAAASTGHADRGNQTTPEQNIGANTAVRGAVGIGGADDPYSQFLGAEAPDRSVQQSLGFRAATGIIDFGVTTRYDLASNQSAPRQIAAGCSGSFYAVWMDVQAAGIRYIRSASFLPGSSISSTLTSPAGGGFPSLTIDGNGYALAAWHRSAGGGTFTAQGTDCTSPALTESGLYPDTVVGVSTGITEGSYVWPQVAVDRDGSGNWFAHVVSHESPLAGDTSGYQSLVYWRSQNNNREPLGTAAIFIDSITSITATIVAHPDQADQRVAIIYNKPRVYPTVLLTNDNIVYRESTDLGATWGAVQSIYSYAAAQSPIQNSTTLYYERGWENSGLYASDGCLHVLFNSTWSDTGQTPQGYLLTNPARLYHWDDCNRCATIVDERKGGAAYCAMGGLSMRNIAKINIAECSGRLYAVYSKSLSVENDAVLANYRDCSPAGFTNFEVVVKASSTAGLSWGPDSNITRTNTDNCSAGSCSSELHLGTVEHSTDSLRILYLEDRDAGISVNSNGSATDNPVKVQSVGCFTMASVSRLEVSLGAITYPFHLAPSATKDTTVVISNVGNVSTPWSVSATGGFMTFPGGGSGVCPSGCIATESFTVRISAPGAEGYYSGSINFSYASPDKQTESVISIPVELYDFTNFYLPRSASIRTATNRLCFNQASEIATVTTGSRFTYFADNSEYLYDGYLILGNSANNLSYSVFGNAFTGLPSVSNPFGHLYAASPEMVCDSVSSPYYSKASGRGINRDTTIGFSVDWYAPKDEDSSDFYVGQFKVYKGSKNPTGTISNLSVSYYADWDLPSDTNAHNSAGSDPSRSLVWLRGAYSSANLARYGGTAAYRNDGNPIVGGWLVDQPTYIYPQFNFENDSLWSIMGSLVQGGYRIYSGTPIDVSGGILVYRDAVINGAANDTLRFVVVLAATRDGGINGLTTAVDKAQEWLCGHGLARGADICPGTMCGDPNGDGSVNISDAVYLLSYIFGSGSAPVDLATGDANGSGCIDVADVVFLCNYVFVGGAAPGPSCNVAGCTNSVYQDNEVRIECPVAISSVAPGDSVAIDVHLTNTVNVQGFSLGFSHNSPNLEFSSAARTALISGIGQWYVKSNPASNEILVGLCQIYGASLTPQSDGHAFTMYLKNVSSAPAQCIDIDSAFVGPAGPFIFAPTAGGSIAAKYVDCGPSDISIGEACPDSFRIALQPWSFGNSETSMWPSSWWQQYDYCNGATPCKQYCLLCGPSDYPNWDIFAEAIGLQQAYFDPPPGEVSFRPSAIAEWEALRGAWTGSCFGFAASGYLFADQYLDVGTVFPGYSNLAAVPLGAASRSIVNKYYLYQFGMHQQQLINAALTTTTPTQTLADCRAMFVALPRNDRVLMLFNQAGSGGHAVAPYRCLQDGSNPNIWYLYVYDSNFPADTSMRIALDLAADTWSYSGQPGWGGSKGLFLLDPVLTYASPLLLADTAETNTQIRFYFGEADSVSLESTAGTMGFDAGGVFGNVPGGSPIIPADGVASMPIGYLLPTGDWYSMASGVVDGVFTYVDGDKHIFRNGGAKSGIISCYFKADAIAPSLTSYGSPSGKLGKGVFDSCFIEVISIAPDSEVSVSISGLNLAESESLTVTLTANESIQVDNFGAATSYDLQIQIVTPATDTIFYTPDIPIGAGTSQLFAPDWRNSGSSLVIAIDTSMSGDFDSTVSVTNESAPQFVCGDANGNGSVSISDAVFLIRYIFAGGAAPSPIVRGDANCNGAVSISDVVYLINYIFAGGAHPCSACH